MSSPAIKKRLIIRGTLKLLTPTSFSNGKDNGLVDIPIRRDEATGRPFIPGTTMAGALRGYLAQVFKGQPQECIILKLFGHVDEIKKESHHSWLFVDDAFCNTAEYATELRDGVAIDPKTKTAMDQAKYDLELLAAGTTFDLHFEYWMPQETNERPSAQMTELLATALYALEAKQIPLGGRKRRGFGECTVNEPTDIGL